MCLRGGAPKKRQSKSWTRRTKLTAKLRVMTPRQPTFAVKCRPMQFHRARALRSALPCAACWLTASGCAAPGGAPTKTVNAYQHKIKYQPHQTLTFADFDLTYSGQTKVIPKQYPRGFIYYNFVVKAGSKTQKIIWSSGTGLIDATDFSVAGKGFQLELKSSVALGRLAEDELVVSPVNAP